MLFRNMMLHNVADVEEFEDGSFQVIRFPKAPIEAFDAETTPLSGQVGRYTTGCELRFVAEGAEVTLSAIADGTIEIWKGEFFYRMVWLNENEKKTICLPPTSLLTQYNPAHRGMFSSDVWRVRFGHDTTVKVHEVKPIGAMRPPTKDELPKKTIIAYGSSITHSAGSVLFNNSYLATIGTTLGVDVLCKGMGGSCYCQKAVADFLPTQEWDLAILELGVNMVNSYTAEEFKRRASEVVRQTLTKGKPVVMISMFTYFSEFEPERKAKDLAFMQAYKEIYDEQKCENLYYIDGGKIVDDWTYLTVDLLHPSPNGHVAMGNKIAKMIRDEFHLL